MDAFVTFYQAVPPFVWAFIFGTPAIVLFVNVLKKFLGVNSTFVIHTLTASTAFLVTALPEYVLHNPKPFSWLGAYASAFFVAANFLYAFCKIAAPFFKSVSDYENKKAAGATSVSSTTGTATPSITTTTIPVADGTVFEG